MMMVMICDVDGDDEHDLNDNVNHDHRDPDHADLE